jgi:hypothetical protein
MSARAGDLVFAATESVIRLIGRMTRDVGKLFDGR